MPDEKDNPHALLADLRQEVAVLTRQVAELAAAADNGPYRFVFAARKTGATTWQEQAISGTPPALGDMPDGRKCDSATDISALVDRGASVVLVEQEGASGRYYIEIGGGGTESVGEFEFMVRCVVAQGVGGWDLIRFCPLF